MKQTLIYALIAATTLPTAHASTQIKQVLAPYKHFLEIGTYESFAAWPQGKPLPRSRHYTFKKAFEHFERTNGKIVVELGTTRSFTHGGLPGCLVNNRIHWTPDKPANWDWGAGSFTRMAAEALAHLNPEFHTLDLNANHIAIARVITENFPFMHYHVCTSEDFLHSCDFPQGIDLLYMDTGDMNEATAWLQLAEAKIVVERNLIADNGIILIDDVRNQSIKQHNATSEYGKSKYALPYLLGSVEFSS